MRLTSPATVEIAAGLTGPESAVVTDYRLDDRALNQLLLEHTGQEFAAAVQAYLQVAEIRRDVGETELAAARTDVVSDNARDVAALAGGAAPERDAGYYAYIGLGLLATVAITVVVTRIARRALDQAANLHDESDEDAA